MGMKVSGKEKMGCAIVKENEHTHLAIIIFLIKVQFALQW